MPGFLGATGKPVERVRGLLRRIAVCSLEVPAHLPPASRLHAAVFLGRSSSFPLTPQPLPCCCCCSVGAL